MRRRVLLGALLGALFALGWWAGGSRAANGLYSGLDLFIEVLQTVQANYVDPVDTGKLVTGAMRGVAHGLDPWSRYLDPDAFRNVRNVIQGALDGIGASVAIAGQFLPIGALVTSTQGRAAGANQRYTVMRSRPEVTWPLAVLVDGGSASASEILAGALQDHDRAILVGDTTFGKGVAQQIYPLRSSLGALQLTVSRYLTPSGRSIHRQPLLLAGNEADDDEEAHPADKPAGADRAWHTDAGRIVRGGAGLAPDVRVPADSLALRMRMNTRHPGGAAGAARDALSHDPDFPRPAHTVARAPAPRGGA